jgi:hypothetical protein
LLVVADWVIGWTATTCANCGVAFAGGSPCGVSAAPPAVASWPGGSCAVAAEVGIVMLAGVA